MSVDVARDYANRSLPSGAVGKLFHGINALCISLGGEDRSRKISVSFRHSAELTERADWAIEQLYAVTDLSQGHPSMIALHSHRGLDLRGLDLSVYLCEGYQKLTLKVEAPNAEVAHSVLSLADRYLDELPMAPESVESVHPDNSVPTATTRDLLSWMEHHPVYRAIAVLVTVASAVGLVVGWLHSL